MRGQEEISFEGYISLTRSPIVRRPKQAYILSVIFLEQKALERIRPASHLCWSALPASTHCLILTVDEGDTATLQFASEIDLFPTQWSWIFCTEFQISLEHDYGIVGLLITISISISPCRRSGCQLNCLSDGECDFSPTRTRWRTTIVDVPKDGDGFTLIGSRGNWREMLWD